MSSAYSSPGIACSFPAPHVLLIELDRKPVNAFNTQLWLSVQAAFNHASEDPDVRAIVFGSRLDKGFTAGLDLLESNLDAKGSDPARTALVMRPYIKLLQDSVSSIQNCFKPVIAATHGICLGAGIDLISACDVRLCADKTLFSIKEVDIGLAADVGSLQRLPKVTANASLLYELALTARNFGPDEATKLGLVSTVVQGGREQVLQEALRIAKLIASKSPIATLSTKHLLNYSREHTVQDGLDYTTVWQMSALQAEDLPLAFQAFSTKKAPTFPKLAAKL
ncbi:uncharacterized protein JCM15063_001075 [Sporobolomyces koalae]|uniref:uncharacterized protein n=1 Tax=Sporobolomyces koalae TaxID=500713 RepID=UPI0031803C62